MSNQSIAVPAFYGDIERLKKEIKELRAEIEALKERERRRDEEEREGLLLMVRGAEKRLKLGKYSPEAVPAREV